MQLFSRQKYKIRQKHIYYPILSDNVREQLPHRIFVHGARDLSKKPYKRHEILDAHIKRINKESEIYSLDDFWFEDLVASENAYVAMGKTLQL
jgi:hypothetical protein